jgi:two-component system cell cycle response regulator
MPGQRGTGGSIRLRLIAAFLLVLVLPVSVVALTGHSFKGDAVVVAAAILIGLIVAVLLTELFVRPLRELASTAERAARGEVGAAIQIRSADEIGAIARAFNELSATLRARITEADASRDEVRNSVRRLGEALRSTHDLRKMLSVVLETALVAVQGKSGAIYLLSAKRTDLYVKVGRHLPEGAVERRVGVGKGLAGWVAAQRGAARIPADAEAPVPVDPEPVEATALAVPLETNSQLLGVLAIYGRTTGAPFGESDVETIKSLARQAGVGVENVLLHQEAQRMSITDGLTGIWNYRYFQMKLSDEYERHIRFGRTLSLLVIDIDKFKDVNDRFGHQRGDAILIELAHRVVSHVRMKVDTLARYGGEEFILILPETGREGARVAAEKIRAEVAARPFGNEDEAPIPVTVSIGYAVYPDDGNTPQVLLHAADQAMYEAKARGRNRVAGYEEIAPGTLAQDPARP